MKKSLIVVLALTLLLSLLMGITAFADKFTVVKVVADLSKFTKITDTKDTNGYIYAFNDSFSSKGELATVGGKKLVKITANGGAYNYFHSRLGVAADNDLSTGTPDGLRIFVKTEGTSFAISVRFDVVQGDVVEKFLFYNIALVDKDGNNVEFEFLSEGQVVIPANFEGYIVVPFDGEYIMNEGEDSGRKGENMKGLYQFLFVMDPVDNEEFDGDVIYFGNYETVKIQKSTAAPSTPAPTTAAPTTEAPVTTEPANETTEPTATEVATSAPVDSTAPATATTAAPTETEGAGNGWVLPVIIAAVVIAGGITAFILIKKRAKNA